MITEIVSKVLWPVPGRFRLTAFDNDRQRHEDERKHLHQMKNITLTDHNCRFVVSKENVNEMVLQTPYGKCGALVHQTGLFSFTDVSLVNFSQDFA